MNLKYFDLSKNELEVNGLALSKWAEKVGSTPFYLYDRQIILKKIAELRAILPTDIKLHYAIKANPLAELVDFMAQNVDGFDIASDGELKLALAAGMNPEHIGFAGPGKTDFELEQALAAGVLISVESKNEILRLAKLAKVSKRAARVALRINPAFEMKSSGMKMAGGAKVFGIDSELIPEACELIYHHGLELEGVHIYAGSQVLNAEIICETQGQCFELLYSLKGQFRKPLKVFNFGGGFGVPYFSGDSDLDLLRIKGNLDQLMPRFRKEFPNAKAVIELGRFLVAEAGIFVSRIVDKKTSRGVTYLVLDGGMNNHLAASGNLGQMIKRSFPICVGNKLQALRQEVVSVAGPLCTPLDSFASQVQLNESEIGDLVVIFQSGAYGLSSSPIHFLSHKVPREILV